MKTEKTQLIYIFLLPHFPTEIPALMKSKERICSSVSLFKREEIFSGVFCHPVDSLSCLVGQNYVTFPSLNQLLAVNQYTNLGLTPEMRMHFP